MTYTDEASKTWPKRQSLVDFTLSNAQPLITDMVDDYFYKLMPPLQHLREKVTDSVRAAQMDFDALKDALEVHNQTSHLGPDFVRYTLKLDNFHV